MLLNKDRPKVHMPMAEKINMQFSVRKRLELNARNRELLEPRYRELQEKLYQLTDQNNLIQKHLAYTIQRELRFMEIQLIQPILTLEQIDTQQTHDLSRFLRSQFTELSVEEKLNWLETFSSFILTKEIAEIYATIEGLVNDYQILGQQFNLLIGGPSGSGKTSLLFLLYSCNPAILCGNRTIRAVNLTDAPPYEASKKALPRRLLQDAGGVSLSRETEDTLYDRIMIHYKQSNTILQIVDEAQNLGTNDLLRRFIDFSNRCQVSIVCASDNPDNFLHRDEQAIGRWKKLYKLNNYRIDNLKGLIGQIDLLLPFPELSGLTRQELGLAEFIQAKTGGVLRDVLHLVTRSSQSALRSHKAHLTMADLKAAAAELHL